MPEQAYCKWFSGPLDGPRGFPTLRSGLTCRGEAGHQNGQFRASREPPGREFELWKIDGENPRDKSV
ncbi:UDPGT domain-containing protein [Psidium guajava]|nr:UDPGT domain-containing protein [Psidium guajava]